MAVRIEPIEQALRTGVRMVRMVADADGGTQFITTSELCAISGGMAVGFTFQLGLEGGCTVFGTLFDPKIATNPDPLIQSIVPWDPSYVGALPNVTLTRENPDAIYVAVTALKLVFTGPAILTIACV